MFRGCGLCIRVIIGLICSMLAYESIKCAKCLQPHQPKSVCELELCDVGYGVALEDRTFQKLPLQF